MEVKQEQKTQSNIGLYAIGVTILIFIFGQTAAGFYWAGGQGRGQDELAKQMTGLKSDNTYVQAQLQVLATKVAGLEAQVQALKEQKRR